MAYKQCLTAIAPIAAATCNGKSLWTGSNLTNGLIQIAAVLPTAEADDIKTRDKLAVPSPWSNIISFDLLLDTPFNYGAIKDNTLNEWRTLLAIVALRKIKNIPVTLTTIKLSACGNQFCDNILAQYPKNGVFKDIVVENVNKNKASWDSITFIKLESRIIGMLTPSNIVCSRYSFEDRDEAVEWLENHRLMLDGVMQDPIKYILQSNGREDTKSYTYMVAWLTKIKEFLKSKDNNGIFYFDNRTELVGRLDSFIGDIEAKARANNMAGVPIVLKESIDPSNFMNVREMIDSIQGEHAWISLLITIAFSNLSDYKISYKKFDQVPEAKKLFHSSIISDYTAKAVLLNGMCIGAVRNRQVLSVLTNSPDEKVTKKLISIGLMGEGGEFENPVNFALETAERYTYILKWTTFVKNTLEDTNFVNNDAIAAIDNFINQLKAGYNEEQDIFKLAVNNYNTPEHLLFEVYVDSVNTIGQVSDLFENIKINSDYEHNIEPKVRIKGGADLNSDLLLFSEETIGADCMNLYLKKDDPFINIKQSQASIFDPGQVFTNKLYYIETVQENSRRINFDRDDRWITRRINGQIYHYTVIWPIKESVMSSIKSSTIYDGISLKYDEDEDECTITLTLAVGLGGKPIEAKFAGPGKLGAANSAVISGDRLPGVSIWPYTEGAGAYFIYETKEVEYIGDNEVKLPNPYEIRCMPSAKNLRSNNLELTSNEQDFCRNITYRDSLPEYIAIEADGQYCGIIPLKQTNKMPENGNTTFDIGFDFGTSSTTVYAKSGIANSAQVRFDTALQDVYAPIKHIYDDVNNFFIPNDYSNNKFYPSIIRISSNKEMGIDINGNKLPLLNSSIMYQYKYAGKLSFHEDNDKSIIKSNLKWDADSPELRRKYLRQIVLQTLMYVKSKYGSKVKWHASFPSAYSQKEEGDYQRMLGNTIDDMHKIMNINIEPIDAQNKYDFQTESVAAAKYIVNTAAQNGSDCVLVVDIGGGSTDISAWKTGPGIPIPVFQTSIEVASRKIFLEPLKKLISKESSLFEYIKGKSTPFDVIKDCIGKTDKDSQEDFTTLVEQLLLLEGDTFRNIINGLPDQKNAAIFSKKVVAGFYAIVYYAVKTLVSIKNKKAENGENMEIHNVLIRLGGNGAKLYDWIHDDYRNSIKGLLCKILGETGEIINIKFEFNQSEAKTEAARGLLDNVAGVVAVPEKYSLNGSKVEFTYRDANDEVKNVFIDETENLKDNEAIKYVYETAAEIKGIEFRLLDDSEMFKEYLEGLQKVIFADAEVINIDEANMKTNVINTMNYSLKERRLTSPLFAQLEEVINSL